MDKLFILALDGVPYEAFIKLRDQLPNLAEIADRGSWGVMRAVDPPITVPAWASMFTGKDPGELGIYGFRHMRRHSYDTYIVTSVDLREKYVWERRGLRSVVIGLPPGYPPRQYGIWISDFLTPKGRPWTHPPQLAEEIGHYIFDIEYRTDRKEEAYRQLAEMTHARFRVAQKLLEKEWDVFVLHEIGTDRAHHLFQKYWDPQHPKYAPDSPHADKIPTYYQLVDQLAGQLIKRLPPDTQILAISDHGNQAQRGVLAINQLLREWGLVEYEEKPGEDIEKVVNWRRTKAVAWGGYYARIYINTRDRPQGTVDPEEAEDIKKELKKKLRTLKAPWGYIENQIYEPRQLYRKATGDYPDLVVYLDEVRVRPVQTIGHPDPWLPENDRGPDDSLHSFNGFYAATWGDAKKKDIHALDVAQYIEALWSA
ncbi:type I phosphodiesterase/nucleotide pyrophosphatase [Pyrobaculum islandicum DSM 4184]|uniref:Type I phosphodiesterase/nucleotide pyrophosphatase n=1 Tax=Pyrobaculum islandicum (strain DSM 4184 / JCM 9189 / GEO3) TaxID=384616 RepID=A1RUN4_PYRIL|nr:alkaline phosphatase family protein [Pyrobaculum islandicum]ABL88666.1 type I phosphodiesterase/nucleotide pyrophosphatase [Pyrobaculum islandicum DSM 4184]